MHFNFTHTTQGLNHSHKHISSLTQLDDYHPLLMAISQNNIPHLQQIIKVVIGNGTRIHEVVNKIEDAIEGTYRPWGYNASNLDIAMLIYQLRGWQLLFAISVFPLSKLFRPGLYLLASHLPLALSRTRTSMTTYTPSFLIPASACHHPTVLIWWLMRWQLKRWLCTTVSTTR